VGLSVAGGPAVVRGGDTRIACESRPPAPGKL